MRQLLCGHLFGSKIFHKINIYESRPLLYFVYIRFFLDSDPCGNCCVWDTYVHIYAYIFMHIHSVGLMKFLTVELSEGNLSYNRIRRDAHAIKALLKYLGRNSA